MSLTSGSRPYAIGLAGHPFVYEIRTADTVHGTGVVELLISAPDADVPITQQDLRRIPLQRLAAVAAMFERGGEFDWTQLSTPEKRPPQKPGPRGYDDEFYSEIARMAREAVSLKPKISARQHIASNRHVSKHTADKWLKECRKRGFLTPGELRTNRKEGQR